MLCILQCITKDPFSIKFSVETVLAHNSVTELKYDGACTRTYTHTIFILNNTINELQALCCKHRSSV